MEFLVRLWIPGQGEVQREGEMAQRLIGLSGSKAATAARARSTASFTSLSPKWLMAIKRAKGTEHRRRGPQRASLRERWPRSSACIAAHCRGFPWPGTRRLQ